MATKNNILQFFKYKDLPDYLRETGKAFSDLANIIEVSIPNCAEKSAGLRKLLEAKDCFLRAQTREDF